jgi:hypothetical protein
MSACVVEPETIARIIEGLICSLHTREMNGWYGIYRESPTLNPSMLWGEKEYREKFAAEMHAMNVKAVCHRYSDEKPDNYPWIGLPLVKVPSPSQMLKSLQCFLYQCSIATRTPEYEAAQWG